MTFTEYIQALKVEEPFEFVGSTVCAMTLFSLIMGLDELCSLYGLLYEL